MQLLKRILNKLNGLHFPQEYLCLAKEKFSDGLHVYMVDGTRVLKDLTDDHLFVGYSPLIFALHKERTHADADNAIPDDLQLIFTQQCKEQNEPYSRKEALASLRLQKWKVIFVEDRTLFFYKGSKGSHHFTNFFHQAVQGLYNNLHNRKPGNVFLEGNLYKQVQIAYSVPRIISAITVGYNGKFNLFPTDLHGAAGDDVYVGSLRHGGKASQQVALAGKMLISQIHFQDYQKLYALGKNHMQELRAASHFGFGEKMSAHFHLPYLSSTLFYRELELNDHFDIGIHRIMVFKIISSKSLKDEPATLAHIHNSYATWRYNNSLGGNYLLR